jgi:two-component system nitrogen regulation sensor histidine kinase NtrY
LRFRSTLLFVLFILLLAAGAITAYLSFRPDSLDSIANKIAADIQQELKIIDSEIPEVLANIDSPSVITHDFSYPFFIYDHDSLVYWSDNHYVPSGASVADTFEVKFMRAGNESFLLKKTQTDNKRYVVSLITLHREYIINNDYLNPEWNTKIFPQGNVRLLEYNVSNGIPICVQNNCLFRVMFLPGVYPFHEKTKIVACVLFTASLIVFLAWLYNRLAGVGLQYPELKLLFLYLGIFALRLAMTELNFPSVFIHTALFDPQVFAFSDLSASLGDLLLNTLAVLALCYYVFKNYFRFRFLKYRTHKVLSWVIMVFAALCVLFAGLFPFIVIQTIYNNSSLVLDISQSLHFTGLRIVAIVIVLLSGLCAFLFSHAFIRILASEKKSIRALGAFVIGIVIFIGINEYTGQPYGSSLIMTCLYFALVYFLKLYSSLTRLSYTTFTYLFICIFSLSANAAYGVQRFSEKEKIESQFRFANNFLIDRDYFGEYLLHEASIKIANDAFTQSRITSPFLGKDAIGQKIRQFLLPSYFNKYDVEIYIFNAMGQPVDNELSPSFSEVVSKYDAEAFRTDYEGIYFVNNPESDVTQKYLIKVPIQRLSVVSGYVVVELSLKKIIPDNVYPELLVDYRFQQFYRTEDLNYAVYVNKNILFTSGEYNYEKLFNPSWLGNTDLYTEGITKNEFDHIAQEDQNGRIAVVSTKAAPFPYKLANFSFLFVLGLFIILIMLFIQGVYNYFRGSRLFFSARIQLYLNLAFFVPLIIVSVSTLSLTSRSSQQQLDTEYLNKSRVFGQQITSYLNTFGYREGDDLVTFNGRLTELASLSTLDANIYKPEGVLFASSQPLIFENHLISPYINGNAFDKIKEGENTFIESEQVGKLKYFIAYTALKSPQTAKLIGILGIPFFQSSYLLEKIQIVILTNILNIFAFIFIILLVLSYFVSQWLTFPLRFITQSLRRTSLTKVNNPLTWNTNDEIGLMAKEYNSMLFKLSESKSELEQTQREKAWREIAQQVAHEIKNPLTPMKLTLQQLERSLLSGNMSAEKSHKAIAALLAQVDTLNEIASSFSGFAKMPEPVIRRFEIVAAVKRTVDLHSPSGSISFKTSIKEGFVMGDEQMLSRTFSNIILNALQSGNPGQRITVQVSITKVGEFIRIEFKDNGKGIEPEIADRVFLPHFSTKKSGSGLGLAISKQGIEQMNGRIWFETIPGSGTSFFIELPVALA